MKYKNKSLIIQPKKISREFTGKKITMYAGLSSLMPFILTKLNLFNDFEKLFPTNISNATKFSNSQILLSVILSSLCGVFRVTKISNFTNDILVQNLLKLNSSISNQTLTNIIKILGLRCSNSLIEYNLDKTQAMLSKSKLTKITIDTDSTVINVCGKQEGAEIGFNAYKKGARSYHPLIAFVSELKIVANSWFRTGSAYTANGICDFVKQISLKIPDTIESVFFRADSGFFNGALFDLLEQLNYEYLVKVKLYSNIANVLKLSTEWKIHPDNKNISVFEFEYQAKNWKKKRVLKAVRIFTGCEAIDVLGYIYYEPQYKYFCYCSNLKLDAYKIHLNYAERATSETWIEQVKSHLNAGKTIIDDFNANDIFWQLSILAYNISVIARFKWKKFFKEEHRTFKDWFINVPALLVSSGRKTIIKIYKYYHNQRKWKEFDDLLLNW